MFEGIDKRIQKLEEANTAPRKSVELDRPRKPPTTPGTEFEKKVREGLKKGRVVEVFEKGDGMLAVNPVIVISDRGFIFSLCANAALVVLLISKIIGAW